MAQASHLQQPLSNFTHESPKTDLKTSSRQKVVVKIHEKFMVAALAGVVGSCLTYPMDIVKTAVQSSTVPITVDSFRGILRSVKSTGFYRGFSAVVVGIMPEKALKLTVNDTLRDYFEKKNNKLTVGHEIIAGSASGFIQLFATVPYECIKIRMQMGNSATVSPEGRSLSVFSLAKSLGFRGVYRGFTATMARDVPFCVLFFPMYAKIKSMQIERFGYDKDNEPFHLGMVSGMIAGAIAGGLVTPADMLKTRIQQGINGDLGFFSYASQVIRKEGLTAVFKGWQARVLVISPLYGFVSLAYEVQKYFLSRRSASA